MSLRSYATLTQMRDRQGDGASDTSNDTRYLSKLRSASAWIERQTGRIFQPMIEAIKFDYEDDQCLLWRGHDLLELTSVVDGVGTVDAASINLLGGGPYYGLEVDATKGFLSYATVKAQAITVTGIWGWHDDWSHAWKSSGDAIPVGGITDAATTFTVADADGVDSWGLSPRFQVGQLLKVDAEYMHLVGVNTITNTLTVVRAANGSTAAAHLVGATISVFMPLFDLDEICLRLAAFYFAQDSTDLGRVAIDVLGNKALAARVPPDIMTTLEPYCRVRIA